jgi:pyrimidine deaminase RibD-like protein
MKLDHSSVPLASPVDAESEDIHLSRLQHCLSLASRAPQLPTNYCVGALLIDPASNKVLETGYTMELPGNTHAEQCCLAKFAYSETDWPDEGAWLYTTVEPCVKRLSGENSCVERILESNKAGRKISTVFVGVLEPAKFVSDNNGRVLLEQGGVKVIHIGGLEKEILETATAGHVKSVS